MSGALDYGYVVTIKSNGTSDPVHVPTNQWQKKAPGGVWVDISGKTGEEYEVEHQDRAHDIRLEQTLGGAKVYSNTLTVTDTEPPSLASGFIAYQVLSSGLKVQFNVDSPNAPVKVYYKQNESDDYELDYTIPAGWDKGYQWDVPGFYAFESHNLIWVSFSRSHMNAEFVVDERSDFSHCTELNGLFNDCRKLNQDFSWMDTSNCYLFDYMFKNCSEMQGEIDFDVSNATSMVGMLQDLNPSKKVPWNPDLSNWDVSGVTNMNAMFYGDNGFNNNSIVGWDTSKVKDMAMMFDSAAAFNQDLSGWCAESVTKSDRFDQNSGFAGQSSKHPKFGVPC